MSDNTFPFRRMTQALLVPVGAAASSFQVPSGVIKPDYNAFAIYNPNTCAVELRGTSKAQDQPDPTAAIPASGQGIDWVFPPDFWAVFSTQYPMFMPAIALDMPGKPIPGTLVPLRLWYGYGA